jgi:phosphoribosylanthranilate isomerase
MNAKICGITNLADALISIENGAWALGFNFYKDSPRYLEPSKAKAIITKLPSSIIKVGIFIDERYEEIVTLMDELGLDLAQIYSDFNASVSLKQNMILSLQPHTIENLPSKKVLDQYGYLLIDAPRGPEGLYGGSGHKAQWEVARILASDYRLILAGGLNTDNVHEAIETVRPFAVDVTTGTELTPGFKDHMLIKQFIEKVQYEH